MHTATPSALTAILAAVALGQAQEIDATIPEPALDRWNYAFAQGGGWDRPTASVFAALGLPGFDDRDGQYFVRFNTADAVPTGLAPRRYLVESVAMTAAIAESGADLFEYDPTFDALDTYIPSSAGGVPDADTGRPIELFAVGYRNGFSPATYVNGSPYGGAPLVPPAEGNRNAFPALLNTSGQPITDVSRNVRLGLQAPPLSVGITSTVEPGALVPAATTFTFPLNLQQPGAEAYIASQLADGFLELMVASLHPAVQGSANGPFFATVEDPFTAAPTLALQLTILNAADWNRDRLVNAVDVSVFFNDWFADQAAGTLVADFNNNGASNAADVSDFLNQWFLGQ